MPDLEAWARPGDSLCTSRKQRPRPEKPTNNTTIHECSVSVAPDDARPPGADRQACDGGLSNGLRPAAHQCGRRALTMTCCRGEATLEHYPASLDSSTQAAHATSRADYSQVSVKRASARRPSCCFSAQARTPQSIALELHYCRIASVVYRAPDNDSIQSGHTSISPICYPPCQ